MKLFGIIFFLITISLLSACGGVKLTDLPKSTQALNLSTEQQEIIRPQMQLIDDIVNDYEFEKSELKVAYNRYRSQASAARLSRYEGGRSTDQLRHQRNAFRNQISGFVRQRRAFTKEIAGIAEAIKANLSTKQLAVFETFEMPKLEPPEFLKRRPYEEFGIIPRTRMGRPDDF